MKKGIYIAAIIILCLTSLTLTHFFISEKEEKSFLQDNIDHRFAFSFQQLHCYLNKSSMDNKTADELAQYYSSLSKNIAICESLLSISSYADDNALQNIMWTFIQMAPPNAYYKKAADEQLINDVDYLLINLNAPDCEKLANSVWNKLSHQLQRIEE